MKTSILIAALSLAATSLTVQAEDILAWDITSGAPTDSAFGATTVSSYVDTGNGLNTFTRSAELTEQVANSVYSSTGWNTTDTFDADAHYISFSLTASNSYDIELQRLKYRVSGGNPAPGTGMWGYTLDGGSSWTFQTPFEIEANNFTDAASTIFNWEFVNFTLDAGDSIEFRFWAYGTTNIAGNTPSSSVDNVRIYAGFGNDVILEGNASAVVPEPSAYALILGGGLMLFAMIRRRSRS